jgi:hypothetical protein
MSKWSQSERKYGRPWQGPLRHYDILKEATIGFAVVLVLVFILAITFSSPDVPPVTVQAWAKAQPVGFVDIALTELNGTSNSATYGPPYNTSNNPATDSVQSLGPISVQKFFGVKYPLNTAKDFVLNPLSTLPDFPSLTAAIATYEQAPKATEDRWISNYQSKLNKLPLSGSTIIANMPSAGPVPVLMTHLLAMAQSGALDAQLLTQSSFYTTNYTRPLLFIGDSWKAQHAASYWGKIVTAEHLAGDQWGVMNETGSWPGQPWLWLYTMWYQISPMSTSGNGDVEVLAIMTVLSLVLMLVPVIPGLRKIPEKIPVYRLIWRNYYRDPEFTNVEVPVHKA